MFQIDSISQESDLDSTLNQNSFIQNSNTTSIVLKEDVQNQCHVCKEKFSVFQSKKQCKFCKNYVHDEHSKRKKMLDKKFQRICDMCNLLQMNEINLQEFISQKILKEQKITQLEQQYSTLKQLVDNQFKKIPLLIDDKDQELQQIIQRNELFKSSQKDKENLIKEKQINIFKFKEAQKNFQFELKQFHKDIQSAKNEQDLLKQEYQEISDYIVDIEKELKSKIDLLQNCENIITKLHTDQIDQLDPELLKTSYQKYLKHNQEYLSETIISGKLKKNQKIQNEKNLCDCSIF